MPRSCAVCGAQTQKTCSGCTRKVYCGTICQSKDWIVHIIDCDNPGRWITPADRLASYIMGPENKLASDNETLFAYGFLTVASPQDSMSLKAVYTELFRDLHAKPSTIEKARLDGRLYAEIEATFRKAGNSVSKKNFSWVRAHPEVFGPKPEQSAARKTSDSVRLVIWKRIGAGPPSATVADMERGLEEWPKDKQFCFDFYFMVLAGGGPNLMAQEYYRKFGYCVFDDGDVTPPTSIAKVYGELIQKCTFDEFYKAFTSSSLVALMDRKGLKSARSKLPKEFTQVLSESPKNVSTIWCLKAFSMGQEILAERPEPPMLIPYGFTNCQSREEINQLMHFYARLFKDWKVSGSQLQTAAENDNIYEYVTRLPKVKIGKAEKPFLQRVLKTNNRCIFGEGASSATQWRCLNTWTYFMILRQIVCFLLYQRDTGERVDVMRGAGRASA
ncbi:hypothetical protein SISSUDRAFT_1130422 [Sistotremastrum suecicum HHB10207 ss-3]|uniref:MYND-type domain-containing protein n=1 Tax=Sistotremastrum suecicum HHB10207 ss-3 TaxID=1314776 RepID=A0A166BFM7_9AGAM|nr:hypothetical protein SISSUDRAFT_1130422 [Sistotremastrum suecicum HHB10207 ss-3]